LLAPIASLVLAEILLARRFGDGTRVTEDKKVPAGAGKVCEAPHITDREVTGEDLLPEVDLGL